MSGISQPWDETRIRSLAKRFGYELAKIVVCGSDTGQVVDTLIGAVRRIDAEAVFTPGIAHFDGAVPDELVRICDVITVSPEETYSRPLPPAFLDGA
ncbi:hypothetical protein [Nocardia sp. NPDC049149]|uniref:hypothetical protein n=1 Tax=Nocardia sp. NPDC049149 TaxID=3364315 RepID=UPI00372067E7